MHVPKCSEHVVSRRSPAVERGRTFVIAGSLALINPMPLAPFFDAMIIGEGREAIIAVSATVLDARARGLRRPAILELLAVSRTSCAGAV